MFLALLGAALVLGLLAWELWMCEGAHLGRHFVVWLYDLAAERYDRIKRFDADWERHSLGEPLAGVVRGLPGVRLLDVGAGTGRVARALAGVSGFGGCIIGLDPSRRMLSLAQRRAASTVSRWVQAWSDPLPFAENTFDLVTCLEVLEFTPQPLASLRELVRVLRPGAWLLVTNRVGWQARWIVGRTFPRRMVERIFLGLDLEQIEVRPWQVDYDLVWARKPTPSDSIGSQPACASSVS
ncbi:MAG: class I SAM-dependent methyltransferase [Chloroflexota bacterium]